MSAAGTRTRFRPPPATSINYLELTFALMGGAGAWLLRLIVNSSLVEYSCSIGATWPIWVTTTAAAAITLASFVASWRYHRAVGDDPALEAARWLARLALMFNVLALAGILLETVPVLFLDVCSSVQVS